MLRPVPIRTKNKNWFGKVWALMTVVRQWEVVENWFFRLPNGVEIIIPKGFIMDGASIPKPLWGLLSPVGLLLTGGLIHDFAYRYDYLWSIDDDGTLYKYHHGAGQERWDKLFKAVNIHVNGMIAVDHVTYGMLRAFGFLAWNENRFKMAKDIPVILT